MAGQPKTRAKREADKVTWQKRYLAHLRVHGLHQLAARYARVSPRHVREIREREPEFAAQCEEAMEHAMDLAEKELRRRAIKGVEKPIYYQGDEVGVMQEYSDSNLQFLLRGRRKDTFGESTKIDADIKLSRESDLDEALDAILGHRPRGLPQSFSGREAGDSVEDAGETEAADS